MHLDSEKMYSSQEMYESFSMLDYMSKALQNHLSMLPVSWRVGSANVRETVRPGAVGQCQHGGGLGALFGLLFSRGALSHLQINPTASKSCYIWEFYWSQVLFAHFSSFRAELDIYFLSWVILEPRNSFAVSCNWGLFSNGCSFVWSFFQSQRCHRVTKLLRISTYSRCVWDSVCTAYWCIGLISRAKIQAP